MYYWLGLSLLLSVAVLKVLASVSGAITAPKMIKLVNISTLDQVPMHRLVVSQDYSMCFDHCSGLSSRSVLEYPIASIF